MFLIFRLARRVFSAFLLVVLATVGCSAGWVLVNALRQDSTHTDAIVVFGAAQFNGTPSPVLANRLDRAFALYSEGVASFVITVGGNQPGDRTTEASSGRAYLHGKGIAWDHMKAIKTGSDTYQSAEAVARWAASKGWTSLTVVSDRCHVARAAAMLRSLGFDVHVASPTSGPGAAITWNYVVRESGGLLRFWLISDRGAAKT